MSATNIRRELAYYTMVLDYTFVPREKSVIEVSQDDLIESLGYSRARAEC
jgi:hypothetical protein